jgi:oxygen-dependent protoporphyrinogen oxidase
VAHDDAAITAAVRAEIAELLGITAPPLEVRVVRWPDAFPQYRPGHLARVARITALLGEIGGIARAGAAYDGIGIPACIRSGTAAAEVVLAGR